VLVQVKNKRERSSPVRPPGVEKTSRLRSRDPVASEEIFQEEEHEHGDDKDGGAVSP
jgi:hypothetical protein